MRHVRLEPPEAPRSPAFDRAAVQFADDGPTAAGRDVASTLAQLIAEAGPAAATLVVEAEPADDALDRAARSTGFALARTTLQLRRPLPLDDNHRGEVEPIATRPFRPGVDEDAWVAVNNRAFAWHPDQSGRTRNDIAAEQTEPWFRADGFLIHERADGEDGPVVDGFCWTKIHRQVDPPLGEIYVIGVDPDQHGHGLGRSLVVAGLDWLAGEGLTVAMLYVEADNVPALRLYESLGFVEQQSHRWWRRALATEPSPAGPAGSPPP
jgi:mycothiol synthase